MTKQILEHEAFELALSVLGCEDLDHDDLEEQLYAKFNIDFASFRKLASALLTKTMPLNRDGEVHFCYVERYDDNSVVSIARIIEPNGNPNE